MKGFLVNVLVVAAVAAAPQKQQKSLLSVFQIVKFNNDVCTSDNAKMGTCYTEDECTKMGGTAAGTCAGDYGVCCEFSIAACGESTSTNNTYFSAPSSLPSTCTLEICPCSTSVSQLRLDLTAFTLDGPDTTAALPYPAVAADALDGDMMVLADASAGWLSHTNTHGQCTTDSMAVTSTGTAVPVICGENAGQHMYVEMDGTTCVTLTITIATAAAQTWDILVSQIETGMEWEAPVGCLQYHTGSAGSFSSFNLANNVHLADQDYNICMRREADMCSITYTATTYQVSAVDFPNNFGSGNGKCNSVDLLPADLTVAVDNLQLGNDWLYIPMGSDPLSVGTFDRFCGKQLHANDADTAQTAVTSSKVPFVVGVVFDSSEAAGTDAELGTDDTSAVGDADRGDVGFDIAYLQNAC